MKIFNLLLLSLLTGSLSAFGQTMKADTTGKVWGINECVQYAWSHNLDIQSGRLTQKITESEKNRSFSQMMPSLSLNAGHNWNATPNAVSGDKSSQSANAGLSGALDLFSGAQKYNSYLQSSATVESGIYDLEARKNSLKLTVIQAYLQVLLNRERLIAANSQVEVSARNLVKIKAKAALGLASDYMVLQGESQLAADDFNSISQESNLRLAELNLKQVLNYPSDSLISIQVLIPVSIASHLQDSTVDIEPVYLAAKSALPEFKSAEFNRIASDYSLSSSKGAWFPSLSLTYGLSTSWSSRNQTQSFTGSMLTVPTGYLQSDPTELVLSDQPVSTWKKTSFGDQISQNLSPYIGLNLSFPILDNRSRSTRIEQSEIQFEKAKLNEKQTEVLVKKQVESAVFNYRNSLKQFDASKYAFNLAQAAFNQTEKKYEQGLISGYDYLTEKNALQQRETEFLQVKYQHVLNRLTLDYYQQKELEW